MANFTLPVNTTTYTSVLQLIEDRASDIAKWFDGTTESNIPTGAKRWNDGTSKFEEWSGSAWGDLAATYQITVNNSNNLNSQAASYYLNAGNLNAGTLANARVAQSNVTQHQAALSIATSQLTGTELSIATGRFTSTGDASAVSTTHAFQAGLTSGANVIIGNNEIMARNNGVVAVLALNANGGDVTVGGSSVIKASDVSGLSIATTQLTGTLPDARVASSNVTQHQASLSIAATQLTGTLNNATVAVGNVTQHQTSLSIATSQLTGTLPDARVAASNVTQHQTSLSIAGSQLTGDIDADRISTDLTTFTTTTVTIGSSHVEDIYRHYSASNLTATLPATPSGWSVGDSMAFIKGSTGNIIFAAGVGATIQSSGGTTLSIQHGTVIATWLGSSTWHLDGRL